MDERNARMEPWKETPVEPFVPDQEMLRVLMKRRDRYRARLEALWKEHNDLDDMLDGSELKRGRMNREITSRVRAMKMPDESRWLRDLIELCDMQIRIFNG